MISLINKNLKKGMLKLKNHEHHHNHSKSTENEVFVNAAYENGKLFIELQDKNQKAPELEVSHEKDLHLIVVSEDLSEYKHLHPVQTDKGKFEYDIQLASGMYKLFVDIQPKGLAYQATPVHLHVGHHQVTSELPALEVDTEFRKTIDGHTVELSVDSLKAHHPTVFTYDTKDSTPEPYLGALGHVVILDEKGEQFIHVHPSFDDNTVFETIFHQPGHYKVWSEFKFEGNVYVYPFVINVTE
ncbi:hypothetical protein [Exiguobacterium sp. 22311]|jgi:hypothetical protein|uniref:hypothetical protein n=1 Tax=Exiguobacterium sp. 22311 TaxID=3453907 RepID=UPI003F86DFFA